MQRTMEPAVPSPNKYISMASPVPKARGPLQKRGQKNCKNGRNWKPAVRLHFLEMMGKQTIPVKSQQYGCLDETWTRMTDANRHASLEGEISPSNPAGQGTIGHLRMWRMEEIVFPREELLLVI